MPTILHIVKSQYLNEKSFNFYEIWYTAEHLELSYSHVTKYEHFLKCMIADGHHLKSFVFLMQFGFWRVAAFASFTIPLLRVVLME